VTETTTPKTKDGDKPEPMPEMETPVPKEYLEFDAATGQPKLRAEIKVCARCWRLTGTAGYSWFRGQLLCMKCWDKDLKTGGVE